MKKESIYRSYIGNLSNTVIGILMPMITVPYIVRCLGPEMFGEFNFALNITSYFTLFLMLGLPLYGMREIAKYKEDKKRVSEIFIKIETIIFINLVLITIVYFMIMSYTNLKENFLLYKIFYFQILFAIFNLDWFFNGMQKYVTNAKVTIINKIIYTILILVLIRNRNDIYTYAIITIVCLLIQSLSYVFLIKKYIIFDLKYFSGIFEFFRNNIKSILFLFLSILSTQIYVNIDVLMLGIMKGNLEVGYYTAANKIVRIIVTLTTATGPIMLTKLSYEVTKKKDVTEILKKSLAFNYLISIPVTIGGILIADDLVKIILGKVFIPSIFTFKLLMLLPIIISSTYFITAQVLIPLGKDKVFALITLLTSMSNIILNMFLIPMYGANGAAVSTIISELILLVISYNYLPISVKKIFKVSSIKDYIIGSILFGLIIILDNNIIKIMYLRLIINVTVAIIIYPCFLYFMKNTLFEILFHKIVSTIFRTKKS